MNRIKMFLFTFIMNSEIDNLENIRKTILLNLILFIGIIFGFGFFIDRIRHAQYIISIYSFTVFFISSLLIILFKFRKNETLISWFVIITMFSIIVVTGFTGSIFQFSKIILYVFPLITLFLLGIKLGLMISGIVLLYYFSLFFTLPHTSIYEDTHSTIVRVITSYAVIGMFGFVFEFTREMTQKKLERKNYQLNALVAEQKKTESEIKDVNRRLQQFYDLIPSAIYTVDMQQIVTSANKKALEVLGYTSEELVGEHCSLFAIEPCRSGCGLLDDSVSKPISGKLCKIVTKSGDVRLIRKNADILTDENGIITGAVESFEDITDVERIDEELRSSREAFKELIENMGEGVAIVDLNEKFLFVNPIAEKIFKAEGALVGREVREFLNSDERSKLEKQVERRKRGERSNYQLTITDGSGNTKHLSITATPKRDSDGKIIGSFKIFRDVTFEKEREKRILEEKNKAEMYFETADIIMLVLNQAGYVMNINRKGAAELGFEKEEIIGKNWFENFVPERIRSELLREDNKFKSSVTEFEAYHENPILTKDGEERIIAWHNVLVRDADGRILGTLSSGEDVTERIKREDELNKLSTAVIQSSSCIIITDRNGIIEYVNPKMEAMSGYTAEELIGNYVRNLGGGEINRSSIWKTVEAGNEWHGEFYNTKKSGEKYWVYSSVSPIKNKDGEITHYISIQDDITERKAMEAELVRARDEAEAATRAKSDFLANMSHEIRTPMNGIIGMTEIALDTELTKDQREYLQMVKVSAISLLDIINSILDFSKIEAGKFELDNIEFSLKDELGTTINSLAVMADKKNIELIIDIDDDIPERIIGDSGKMRQVITNILGNAVKFTEVGEVYLKILKESESEEDISLRFVVEDTGIGVPSDKIQMIFSPFAQADTSVTRKFGGTGLGTTISKKIVEMMGGQIFVSSPSGLPDNDGRGPGTTFSFNLMFKKAAAQQMRSREVFDLSGLKALAVDDNKINLIVIKEILLKWGIDTVVFEDTEKAVEAVKNANEKGKPFDLILLDVNMPYTDGFTLAEKIMQNKQSPDTIMMLSSSDAGAEIRKCSDLNIRSYIIKPVVRERLYREIVRLKRGEDAKDESKIEAEKEQKLYSDKLILIAEDNAVNQKVATAILAKAGMKADVVSNGREALEALKKKEYCLILMDVQMPEMDGIEATERIRKDEIARITEGKGSTSGFVYTQKHMPIIALTANALKGDMEKFIEAGMDGYLAKPFNREEFLSTVRKHLEC